MSTIVVSNISDGTTTVGASYVTNGSAKAWVNFNGTGTIAARDSLNLSSLTDLGVGNYTTNFSSSFASADYDFSGLVGTGAAGGNYFFFTVFNTPPTTSSFSVRNSGHDAAQGDVAYNSLSFNGDLA